MPKFSFKTIAALIAIFLAAEILSFFSFSHPLLNQAVLTAIALGVFVLSFYRLEYGLLAVLAELFIGSMGHLFFLDYGGHIIGLRIALWLAVLSVFIIKLFYQAFKKQAGDSYWSSFRNFSGRNYFLILGAFVLLSVINGLWRGHEYGLVFADFNAWIYFSLLGPIIAVYGGSDRDRLRRLYNLFLAAAIWLSLKTLILLFVFTHDSGLSADIYLWLRKTLVGEMTPTKTGWPRIFIQGQIFSAIAFLCVFWLNQAKFKWREFFHRSNITALIIAALFLSSVLISFSRSFWVALVGSLAASGLVVWRISSFRRALSSLLWLAVVGLSSFLMMYLVVAWPYFQSSSGNFGSDFLERVSNGNEAALASRWSLLPVLAQEIKKEPFLGQGYGATVTYFSRDPRILQNNPSGEYTTYAFEWGYLDLWLKLGLLGLSAYLWLLFRLLSSGLRKGIKETDYLTFGLTSGLLFLMITNAFTPYLNHPLGIGFLLLASCLIWLNKVY
jgi:hypothetical protein